MTKGTRRRFLAQTAMAAAASCLRPVTSLGKEGLIVEPLGQSGVRLDAGAVRKLASEITGKVITTDAPNYELARLVFNRAFDQRPSLIVSCANASDVARSLDFAQERRLPLAVRGGGHSRAGFGVCSGGLVIDLSPMNRVEVDEVKRVARAGAGSLVRDLDQATQRFGLATTSGGCPTVGIAGFTLGGGEGLLMSKYGAACDNLISAQIVTVDGRQVEASQTANPDLFWAIRGGGGNFGVVTDFTYQLHQVGEVLAGALTYPANRLPELLQVFAQFAATAPDEMNVFGEVLPSKDGARFLIHVCYCGDPQRGNDLLRPLREPFRPREDTIRAMSYLAAQSAGFVPAPFAHFQTNVFVPTFADGAMEAIAEAANDAPPQFRVLIVPLFGAVTRVSPIDMAFSLRQPGFEIDMLGSWNAPEGKPRAIAWVNALRKRLQPYAHGVYVNQLGETSQELVRAAYGSNYARLAEIKKKYDPGNLLRINQNILPA
jgi:FAD/FMN-containing dehydrogenase